ncbi:MAG: hypothetical protein HOP10_08795 [Chitinophagaceae bacterium]|nr:hypothetical protein [Chitinophagaceae bacterium]
MKKIAALLFISVSLFACKKKKGIPDVSGIKVDIPIERFDQSYFSIDTNNITAGLSKLSQEHPGFYGDFMQEILGVSGANTDSNTILVTKEILKSYTVVFNSIQPEYKKTDWLKKELEKAFQFVKYYFPDYKTGKAILFVGPFDAPGVAITANGIAIGLQLFAGKDFSIYQVPEVLELFPLYISRRFSKEYITANCMKGVILELFPDNSSAKPLVEQMIEKGKQWWLLDKFLPTAPDSVKTGFTKTQLDWCKRNEGMIWSEIIRTTDLNSINQLDIQTFIGEAPFTQGFSPENSPGNLGQWIGWQIVKKFVSKNPNMNPEEVMRMDARKILEIAKYKPR